MTAKTYTLLANVDIKFTKTNPWKKRLLISAIIKGAVERAFTEPVEVEVSIAEMAHGTTDSLKETGE